MLAVIKMVNKQEKEQKNIKPYWPSFIIFIILKQIFYINIFLFCCFKFGL